MKMTMNGAIQQIRTRMDLEQLKMPLGFIRILELIFALIAYVSLNSWDFELKFKCVYPGNKTSVRQFTLDTLNLGSFQITKCDNSTANLFEDNYGAGAGFYSCVIVFSILCTVGAVLLYLFWWSTYVSDDRLPLVDLVIVVILGFAWLIGTFSFSISAGRVEDATQSANVKKLLDNIEYCKGADKCILHSYAMYQPLTVSTIAGMGCLMLYAANVWFCYKETANYRARNAHNMQIQQDPYTLE